MYYKTVVTPELRAHYLKKGADHLRCISNLCKSPDLAMGDVIVAKRGNGVWAHPRLYHPECARAKKIPFQ